MRKRIIVGTIFGLIAVCFTFAADYGLIAFDEYRYHSPIITFLYGLINLPILIAMSVTNAGYSQSASTALFFVWWFIVGFLLCWVFERIQNFRRRRQ